MLYHSRLLSFLIVFLFSFRLVAQKLEKVVLPLLVESTVDKKINSLNVQIPYESLRAGPYGWVYSGRWEFGFTVQPGLSPKEGTVDLLNTSAPEGIISRMIRFNTDQTYQLFGEQERTVSYRRRIGLTLAQGEIVRQFHNGWRVGIGFSLYSWVAPQDLSAEQMVGISHRTDVVLQLKRGHGDGFLNGQVLYTFRRYQRLRPSVGFMLTTPFADFTRPGVYVLYEPQTGNVLARTEGRSFQFSANSILHLMGQLGLQYQLNRHFSIDLGASVPVTFDNYFHIPFIGIGARYAFARGV